MTTEEKLISKMKPKQKYDMIATFTVRFNSESMIDEENLCDGFGGNWIKVMKSLYKNDGMGIFEDNPKLIDVKQL